MKKEYVYQLLAALTFFVMLTVNGLSATLPINGMTPGEISDAYPNLFAPYGITFSIWSLIYIFLFYYCYYQMGLSKGVDAIAVGIKLKEVNFYFIISSIANSAWIFSWHYQIMPLSVAIMLVILASLIKINFSIKKLNLTGKEKWVVSLPFSVYFGWITVATVANVTTFLVSMGWHGAVFSESVWTGIILVVGALIGGFTTFRNKDIAYGLVIIWAYIGILIKHLASDGFDGQYPLVISVVSLCLGMLLLVVSFEIFEKRKVKQV